MFFPNMIKILQKLLASGQRCAILSMLHYNYTEVLRDRKMTQRISRAAGYGLAAVAYIAKNGKDGPVMSTEVAETYDFPLAFLLKIMQQMVMANILVSKRGPRGGFSLARPAKDISMLEIIEAADGPFVQRMEMTEITHNAPFAKRVEQVGNEAIDKARDRFQKTKLSKLIS